MCKQYCMGIRLDVNYMEVTCRFRERCEIYLTTNLSEALSDPDSFTEVDAYNNKECDLWQQR